MLLFLYVLVLPLSPLELVYNSFPSNAIIEKPFCHILQAPPPRKSEEELREEEELQLALALSQSEAEHKKVCVVEFNKKLFF